MIRLEALIDEIVELEPPELLPERGVAAHRAAVPVGIPQTAPAGRQGPAHAPLDRDGDELFQRAEGCPSFSCHGYLRPRWAKRPSWTSAGFGSSRAKTASTYGGRSSARPEPAIRVIAQRLPSSCIRAGGSGSPVRSRYAIHGRSTPHAAARLCHCHRRGFTSSSL